MKLTGALIRLLAAFGVAVGVAMLAGGPAAAQQTVAGTRVGPNGEPTLPLFRRPLAGARDFAVSDLRSVGFFNRTCAENVTGAFDIDLAGCGPFFQTMNNGFTAVWPREAHWGWGVPKTEWDSAVAKVPSLANAIGGGWTMTNVHQTGNDDLGPADNSLGLHHAGVTTVNDRTCLQHNTSYGQGNPLLAGSNCPVTWGSEGWKGARPIPVEVWQARLAANPAQFNFDFWRVSDAELDAAGITPPSATSAGKTIGSFQTYGYTSDFTAEILCGTSIIRNYAHVIPTASTVVPGGCTGSDATRRRHGWPLGIEVRFDAFTFQLPALKEIQYYQVTFTNKSQLVYGTGLNYDSLYITLQNGWFGNSNIQQNPEYWVTSMGAMVTTALPNQLCQAARVISDLTCARWGTNFGFSQGAAALIVLKSPIGDQRYKLFSKAGSPFFGARPDLADDTLTFNHGHLCGFRACGRNTFATDPAATPDHERRGFGQISSTEVNVFGNRTISSLTDQVYWHTFRNFGFPTTRWAPGQALAAGGGYNKWAPNMAGISWDYNNDGVQDTLSIDGCFINGCAALWGDTLPNGKYPAYSNTHGTTGVGPIKLMADSTVSFVIAITTAQANDSAGFMSQMAAAIDNYMNFYLAPDAAPKCAVTGVTRAPNAEGAAVGIAWDDSCFTGQWTDKFLAKQYADLVAALPGTALERIRKLNPRLDDTLLFLSTNNIKRLYLYKSCNDGNTWTTLHNCLEGEPATGGLLADVGFQPYATYDFDATTPVPNSFTDLLVLPGFTYTYNLVAETRGANFQIINGDAFTLIGTDTVCSLNCRVETLSLAPVLFHALTGSTGERNVGRAYLPISLQAGGSRSSLAVIDSAGPMPSDRIGVTVTADSLVAATYKGLFADSARATQLEYRTGATLDSVRTRLVLRVPASLGDSIVVVGTNIGGLTPSGATTVVTTPAAGVTSRAHTWATGPVAAVTRRVGAVNSDALLVSNTLTGASATPGAFHTNADYPKFDLSVNRGLSNSFGAQTHLNADGSVVAPLVEPTVSFLTARALQDTVLSANQANGDYRITWGAAPFGAGEQFRLDFSNPGASAAAITASLAARPAVGTGSITDSAAAAIQASTGVTTTFDSLVAVKLPFTIVNERYGSRPVIVAMRKRPAAGKTVVVGFGADTIRAGVPADAWVPGDTLYFIERVAGVQRVTWRRAVIGCDDSRFTRQSCNPVYPNTRGATVYLGQVSGQGTLVRYHTPVGPASSFTFQALSPSRGAALTGNPNAVRAGLAAVRVVPNPYVMLSLYPSNNLMFTHMPPRGVLRIYTVAGQFVQQITWTESNLRGDGDLQWNLRTREGNLLAGGLYIYVLTATDASGATIGSRTDKFVVIR